MAHFLGIPIALISLTITVVTILTSVLSNTFSTVSKNAREGILCQSYSLILFRTSIPVCGQYDQLRQIRCILFLPTTPQSTRMDSPPAMLHPPPSTLHKTKPLHHKGHPSPVPSPNLLFRTLLPPSKKYGLHPSSTDFLLRDIGEWFRRT
jgi:hypothetical protein